MSTSIFEDNNKYQSAIHHKMYPFVDERDIIERSFRHRNQAQNPYCQNKKTAQRLFFDVLEHKHNVWRVQI